MPGNVMFLQIPDQGTSRIELARIGETESIVSTDYSRRVQVA